jgi:hypothetical protein
LKYKLNNKNSLCVIKKCHFQGWQLSFKYFIGLKLTKHLLRLIEKLLLGTAWVFKTSVNEYHSRAVDENLTMNATKVVYA